MLEALITSGNKAQIYLPNSGPGPKSLIFGDTTLGYFGEVTDTQLFGISQVAGPAGFTLGTDHPDLIAGTVHWLKFIRNNRICYIAKRPFRANISWADLYAAGLVYGTRDAGKYPLATPKHQFIQIPKTDVDGRQWILNPRLIKGDVTDPLTNATLNSYAGEWSQLLGRCSIATDGGITPKFATFSYSALGWSDSSPDTIVQETYTSNINQCVVRGDGAGGQIMGAYRLILKTDKSSGIINRHHWRPLLELMTEAEIKDPYTILYRTLGDFAPIINDVRQVQPDAIKRVSVPRVKLWPYQFTLPTYSFGTYARRPVGIKATTETAGLKAFTITGSYVA